MNSAANCTVNGTNNNCCRSSGKNRIKRGDQKESITEEVEFDLILYIPNGILVIEAKAHFRSLKHLKTVGEGVFWTSLVAFVNIFSLSMTSYIFVRSKCKGSMSRQP